MTSADRVPPIRIHRMGSRALLLEVADLASAMALDASLRDAVARGDLPAPADQIPAARTVLLRPPPGADPLEYRRTVETFCTATPVDLPPARDGLAIADQVRSPAADPGATAYSAGSSDVLEVPVVYDGPDLAEVARLTGLDPHQVVLAHTGTRWRVAFGGFAPGFGYLHGGDPRLTVPRRDTPRSTIPTGSVGLAGEFSGIYPRASPGGWQLIGRTDLTLWDPQRDPPALLRPGVTVHFRAVGNLDGRGC